MKALKLLTCAAFVLSWASLATAQKTGNNAIFTAADGRQITSVQGSLGTVLPAAGFTTDGIQSFDGQGAAINVVVELDIGAGNELTGVSWDVGIATVGPSWLSEATVLFSNSDGAADPNGVNLSPGAGQDMPGDMEFSSMGVIDFAGAGLANIVANADGILRLEFFEGFVDDAGNAEAEWRDAATAVVVAGLGLACTDQTACDVAVDPSLAAGPAIAVPTLSTFGLIALALALMLSSAWLVKRRQA